jgi:mono/diheme cytochrome c family protein
MRQTITTFIILAACILAAAAVVGAKTSQQAATVDLQKQHQIERGAYLVTIGGCNDCHTPLKMGPKGPEPDISRTLSGHPEYLAMPAAPQLPNGPWQWSGAATNTAFAGPWGVSYARNLTPDQLTGIGIWSEDMFIKTIRTGKHWGVSRPILPPMPWQNYRQMKDDDLRAVYSYLRSLKPIRNQVPDAIVAPPPAGKG